MKVYIYSLSDPITNEVRYIGKTIRIKKRYKEHIYKARLPKTHRDFWILKLLNMELKPTMSILEECNEENWGSREQYYISIHSNLTNLTLGGEGSHGYVPKEETKEKLRKANTGKKRTEEFSNAVGLRML